MRSFIRFLFSGNDIHKIDIPSLQVEDVPMVAAPPVGSPAPDSLKLRFRQNDPGPVQIRPLLPGTMRFIPEPGADGVLPDAADVSFTSAAYAGWRTLGRLRISVTDKNVSKELTAIAPGLSIKPNIVWYGPVRIPEGFLFNTLRVNLKKATIRAVDGRTIKPNNPDWEKHALAEFLAGRYEPIIQLGTDATQDDVIRFVMPTVEVPASGNIELLITTALAQNPQDGPDADFDDPANPISRDEPLHRRNGLIPAREVYRRLRANMVEEAASVPLRDAMLVDWPNASRFFAISFTRTWELIPNCSAHFPRHTARIQDSTNTVMEQRLPAHGVVFLQQAPASPQPAPPNIQVSLVGGDMKWLLGDGASWREKGQTTPVGIDLALVAQPHIAVRLPMSKALFSDTSRPEGKSMSCTYLSLRRTIIRTLVDNRIAGGRLNFGIRHTSATTRGIIQRAFAGTPVTVNLVADNAPSPQGNPDLALTLVPILNAFFPNNAPQQAMPGTPADPKEYKQGEMAYRLWQSIAEAFQDNATKRNFSDAHIGRGAPGAAVALGLATFHVDPARNPVETDAAYFDRIVGLMVAGLQPGALLQFWNLDSDFNDLKNRSVPLRDAQIATESYGHSPIFVDYMYDAAGNITGLRILDQHGEADQEIRGAAGNRLLTWDGYTQQIWIAANWDE